MVALLLVARSDDSVTLVSNDGERFVVPKRVARMSELVLTVTEDEGVCLLGCTRLRAAFLWQEFFCFAWPSGPLWLPCHAMRAGSNDEIPLPDVKSSVLRKVLEYCHRHVEAPMPKIDKPLKSSDLAECGVPEWDVAYVNVEQETLFELILAANYMDIKDLLDLTCAKVASMIKGKGVTFPAFPRSLLVSQPFY